ncbi:MAG: phosphatase PAP2-related protein, partial [Segetibacter sp.]
LWATLFVSVSRLLTNYYVSLEPPVGLVSLVDPILLQFYGPDGITKDLFYSGHTASVFLAYLILRKKSEKIAALIATIIVGISLLLQHIHYTIDVVTAPFFVYFLFLLARKFVIGTSEQRAFLYKASPQATTGNKSQAYHKRKSLKNT